jgi:ATP-dependent helicase/nuclease subunit A
MAWLRAADTEVKRDMEISRDEVRVMTVHGAKGLEASIVFLVDTTTSPSDTQRLHLIHLPRGNEGAVVVWADKKADDPAPVAAGRAKMLTNTEDEYRRLLYVAMTRAADRLIVGGCKPGNAKSVREFCWYDLIAKGLANSGLQEQTIEASHGQVKRFARPEDIVADTMPSGTGVAAISEHTELPSWLRTMASSEASDDDVLRPSGNEGEGRALRGGETIQTRTFALRRGTLVHRMLQSLPDVAADRRRDAALIFLARNASNWTEAARDTLAAKVLRLIDEPRFAAVFADGSRAEVPIVGRLERADQAPALVSGQIDRLVVTESEVLIVDFKTNQAPPKRLEDIPASYVRQLALYRALLRKLYPQLPIRAALLWTETLEFTEISVSALDAELTSAHLRVTELDRAEAGS